jgi:pimeloyl-ACP methyl ester carboxylesterase
MSKFIPFKNAKIHFTDRGEGDVVILLHGFLGNLKMWHQLTPRLITTNRVVSIDLLGHGQSDSIGYVHSMEDMTEVVIAILNHLSITKVIVIGHSMGGYVGLALLESAPQRIKGICLMNSTAVGDSIDKQNNRDRTIKIVKSNTRFFVHASIPNLFGPKNLELYQDEIAQVKNDALKTSTQSIVAALEGMKIRKDRLQFFKQSKIPKMVILGKKDAILDYHLQQSYYENTDIEVVAFPDGHMSHIENMKEFSDKIVHFIEKI